MITNLFFCVDFRVGCLRASFIRILLLPLLNFSIVHFGQKFSKDLIFNYFDTVINHDIFLLCCQIMGWLVLVFLLIWTILSHFLIISIVIFGVLWFIFFCFLFVRGCMGSPQKQIIVSTSSKCFCFFSFQIT